MVCLSRNCNGRFLRKEDKPTELKVTIPVTPQKLIVKVDGQISEIDLTRFYFGDGKWVVSGQGGDLFK